MLIICPLEISGSPSSARICARSSPASSTSDIHVRWIIPSRAEGNDVYPAFIGVVC